MTENNPNNPVAGPFPGPASESGPNPYEPVDSPVDPITNPLDYPVNPQTPVSPVNPVSPTNPTSPVAPVTPAPNYAPQPAPVRPPDDENPPIVIGGTATPEIKTFDGLLKWLYNGINGMLPFVESVLIGCLIEAFSAVYQIFLQGQPLTWNTVWLAVAGAVLNYITSSLRNAKVKVATQTTVAVVSQVKNYGFVKSRLNMAAGRHSESVDTFKALDKNIDKTILRLDPDFYKDHPELLKPIR